MNKRKKTITLNLEKRAILDTVVQRVHNVTKTILRDLQKCLGWSRNSLS